VEVRALLLAYKLRFFKSRLRPRFKISIYTRRCLTDFSFGRVWGNEQYFIFYLTKFFLLNWPKLSYLNPELTQIMTVKLLLGARLHIFVSSDVHFCSGSQSSFTCVQTKIF
jgi:hypothetical protein